MGAAAWWSFVGASSLLIGAAVGFFTRTPLRVIGLVMGFGAGTLISAVAFDLVLEAARSSDKSWIVIGLVAGAVAFWAGDWLLERFTGGEDPVVGPDVSGAPLVLGATLDGLPESVAISITLLGGSSVSAAVVVAVFLSNIPEAMAATVGLRAAGHPAGRVALIWVGVVTASVLAAVIGYALLQDASADTVAFIECFAAGSILVMLANTMMPEAYANGGREVGLVTVLGFIVASGLASTGG
jgi:ZIP family zinc transporter